MGRLRLLATGFLLVLVATDAYATDSRRLPAQDAPIIPWTRVITPILKQLLPDTAVISVEDKLETLLLVQNGLAAAQLSSPTAEKPDALELAVISDVRPSAFALPAVEAPLSTSPARVCISTGLLEMLENESELAFVLAHEFSHLKHDHFSPDLPFAMFTPQQLAKIASVHQNWEFRADADALSVLQSRGFNTQVSVNILRRLERFEVTTDSLHRRHPAVSERILRLAQALAVTGR